MSESESAGKVPSMNQAGVRAISIKCPAFSEANPNTWFRILEAQFTLKGIKVSSTRFLHALANLPTDVLGNLADEVLDSNTFQTLKEAVISFYTETKAELFEKLISATPVIGRPSSYLRSLQQVASKVGGNEELVRHRYLQSLPPVIVSALASQKSLTLTEIGTVADELSPLVAAPSQVNVAGSSKQGYSFAQAAA